MATSSTLRLDKELIEMASTVAKAMNRSTPKQIEHWARIGRIVEDNPDMSYEFVKELLIAKAEKEAGLVEKFDFE